MCVPSMVWPCLLPIDDYHCRSKIFLQTLWMTYLKRSLLPAGICGMGSCREDFLSEWTRRGLVYRGDVTNSIKEDCYMCQLHYLRYNLLIFEVDPSRVVIALCKLGILKCHAIHCCAPAQCDHAQDSRGTTGQRELA